MTQDQSTPGLDVSRETQARLEVIVAQLQKWQPRINLVAPATIPDLRARHIDDSLQLVTLMPNARKWVDLGSGGGFPGLVVAAYLADFPDTEVVLVESNAKKCAFLRETARLAHLPVRVICARIEDTIPSLDGEWDVVSARALAPLVDLLTLSEPLLRRGAIGLFPKGQDVDEEVKRALATWHITCDLIQSRTEPRARIVKVMSASRR
jgi:16S rRNA (guanine527-N7)-methyltransferase